MKWLTRLFRSSDIQAALELANYYDDLGIACANNSTEKDDAWMVAARRHWEVRDARIWEARQLAR